MFVTRAWNQDFKKLGTDPDREEMKSNRISESLDILL